MSKLALLKMTVSTVIPSYNRRAYIERAIDSVLAQTVPIDEIVVVDDERSTDNLSEFLEARYGSLVRTVRQGGGLSKIRRRGVDEARGEWIAFLDSDDEWVPKRNEELLAAAASVASDVAWIFGDLQVVTDEGDSTTLFGEFGLKLQDSPQVFVDTLSVHYPFQFGLLQGSLIRRSALLEVDCFSEGLRNSEDVLVGFQVASRYRFAAIPSIVGKYYRTSDLATSSAMNKGLRGSDYFRARMLAFASVAQSGRLEPWAGLHSLAVRDVCKALALEGKRPPRKLALEQFRFAGISARSLGFLCAAMFGKAGIRCWTKLSDVLRPDAEEVVPAERGFQSSLRPVS